MPESEKRPVAKSTTSAKGTKRAIEQQELSKRSKPAKAKSFDKHTPKWWAPLMVTLMLVGLIIVVLAYVLGGNAPIPGLGNGNLFLGFGVMLVGFLMTMGWR